MAKDSIPRAKAQEPGGCGGIGGRVLFMVQGHEVGGETEA